MGSNNPVRRVWSEAISTWHGAPIKSQLGCLLSIGTGVPSIKKFGANIPDIIGTLRRIATDTEASANLFIREHTELDDENRYFRFNVLNGMGDILPDQIEDMGTVVDATQDWTTQELILKQIKRCARSATLREKTLTSSCTREIPDSVQTQSIPNYSTYNKVSLTFVIYVLLANYSRCEELRTDKD